MNNRPKTTACADQTTCKEFARYLPSELRPHVTMNAHVRLEI